MKKLSIKIIIVVLAIIICAFYYFTSCTSRGNNNTKHNFLSNESTSITGVVTSASKGLLSIQTETNTTYTFEIRQNTTLNCPNETLGDTVSIEYEGEYSDFAIAKKISVIFDAPPEDHSIVAKSISDTDILFHTSGIITDITKNYITVAPDIESDEQVTILKTENTVSDENISIGDAVGIYYSNELEHEPSATVIKVVSPKPEIVSSDTNIHYITGTVISEKDSTITISKGGYDYMLVKGDNIKSDDISIGDTARVYHIGSFTKGMAATYIEKIS